MISRSATVITQFKDLRFMFVVICCLTLLHCDSIQTGIMIMPVICNYYFTSGSTISPFGCTRFYCVTGDLTELHILSNVFWYFHDVMADVVFEMIVP